MDIAKSCKCKKNSTILFVQMQREQIVGGKYLHDNRGAKKQILGDVQNTSHAV